eukprot:7922881-Karenia_brevis.AAC.1
MRNHQLKAVWKSSLASAYASALCHRWASRLSVAAPQSAFSSNPDDILCQKWEADLHRAVNTEFVNKLVLPTCPKQWTPLWPKNAEQWGGRFGPYRQKAPRCVRRAQRKKKEN